jgi:hypothetical protein
MLHWALWATALEKRDSHKIYFPEYESRCPSTITEKSTAIIIIITDKAFRLFRLRGLVASDTV